MSRTIPILIAAWLAMSLLNAGFVFAHFDGRYGRVLCSERERRSDLAFAIGWSLVPVTWVLTPFTTGVYYDGWRLTAHYTCGGHQ